MTTEGLWQIVANARNGILATIGVDGTPQLSNIYYLCDPSTERVRSRPRLSGSKAATCCGTPGRRSTSRARTSSTSPSWQDPPGRRSPGSPTTPPSRSCSRSTPGWERHRNGTASASRCWPTTGWQSNSTSNASTGRSSTDDGAQGQTTSREGDAVSDEADLEQLRRDVQYLMDRMAILDSSRRTAAGTTATMRSSSPTPTIPTGSTSTGRPSTRGLRTRLGSTRSTPPAPRSTPTTSRRIPARSTATRRTARATCWCASSTTTG